MRKLQNYVAKYGPELGPKFYHLLQSQAAHAGVSARLRRKIDAMNGRPAVAPSAPMRTHDEVLPLFPEPASPVSLA